MFFVQVDGVPVSEKWRAVDQLMIGQRAVEEMQRVGDDIASTVTHFLNLHEALTSAANNTCVATRALHLGYPNPGWFFTPRVSGFPRG
jgi:hypothetical protein